MAPSRNPVTRATTEDVFAQLAEDFPVKKLGWIRAATWIGPKRVPIDQIDTSNRESWLASQEPQRVDVFVKRFQLGKEKPIVLVMEPDNPKYIVVDGHHRTLAYDILEAPTLAYIGCVGTARGPWDELHASQQGRASGPVDSAAIMSLMSDHFGAGVQLDLGPSDVSVPAAIGTKKRALPKPGRRSRARSKMRIYVDHPKYGRVEVRHMADLGEDVLCRMYVAMSADASTEDRVWVQIAKSGHFEGHRAGPFDLNEAVFRDIIQNYKDVDGGRVAFDFEHASESDPTEGSIPTDGAPAQGRIHDLRVDAGNLYAQVEWFEPAKTLIKQGKYWGVSPAIRFNAKHPVTGKAIGARLTSCALTNSPFLREMAPLAAKDAPVDPADVVHLTEFVGARVVAQPALCHTPNEYMPGLRKALKLADLATLGECQEALRRVTKYYEDAGRDASAVVQGIRLEEYTAALRDLVGARPGASWDDVFETAQSLVDGETADATDEDDGAVMRAAIERYHAKAKAAAMPGTVSPEDTTMSDVQLKEVEKKNSELASTVVALTSEKASLTLDLTEAKGKLAKAEEELVKLRDDRAKRDEADVVQRVEEAFTTYKDKKSMSDADKESMSIELRANPEKFERRYPKVKPEEMHLQRDIAGTATGSADTAAAGGKRQDAAHLRDGAGDPRLHMSTRDYTKLLMANDPKLSFEAAMHLADRALRALRASQTAA